MKKKISIILAASMIAMTACSTTAVDETEETAESVETSATIEDTAVTETSVPAETTEEVVEVDLQDYSGLTAEEICASLTLEQKAAQMVLPDINSVDYSAFETYGYGAVLGKYDWDWPAPSVTDWQTRVDTFQENALASEAGIPLFYGQDEVHGMDFSSGNVIFPHNINIGAANDPELTEEYGAIVGSEMIATHMLWTFSPCVACAQDPRWGRTYESYSSDEGIVGELSLAYVRGLLSEGVIACPKHFFGDGYTVPGTGENGYYLDRGDSQMTQEQIDAELAVYEALVNEGVQSIMLSHSSLWGTKMHENAEYISYLKDDLGFEGFIVSDWDSIENCSGADLKENVILCVNAGVDMLMEASNYEQARQYIIEGVNEGSIPMERVDDAVIRILNVKIQENLFEDPYLENWDPAYEFNSDRSHEVARTLAAESFVPLKAGDNMIIEPGMKVFVSGPAADDTGVLCGGWTYIWQGLTDQDVESDFVECNSVLEALQEAADTVGFEVVTDPSRISECDVNILCLGEYPYAEWVGDTYDLSITGDSALEGNLDAINDAADAGIPTVTLIFAGRNIIIDEYLDQWDSCIMCYLPGSEGGNAVADVLTGQVEMTGTLAMPYYSSVDQIGTGECWHDIGWSALQ